jgi:hypothetical protein
MITTALKKEGNRYVESILFEGTVKSVLYKDLRSKMGKFFRTEVTEL